MLNRKQWNKLLDVSILLLVFVILFEILFYHSTITNALCEFVENSGTLSWIVILLLQFLQVVLIPIPAYFITLTSMKMYPNDLTLLFILTLIVVVLATIIAYLIGRKWGKKVVIWIAGNEEEYNKWLLVLQSPKANLTYLATVLLPIFPDDILCLMCGSIKMNFWWFLFCNILGRAIGLITFMFVFTSMGNSLTNIIIFSVLLLICLVFKIILKRKNKNESDSNRK